LTGVAEELLGNDIVWELPASQFSLLADEATDISGIQQLSFGIRFVDSEQEGKFCEEFSVVSCLKANEISCNRKFSIMHMLMFWIKRAH